MLQKVSLVTLIVDFHHDSCNNHTIMKTQLMLSNKSKGKNTLNLRQFNPQEFQLMDSLEWWIDKYFQLEVTTSEKSQKEQRRDFSLFLKYLIRSVGSDSKNRWTPRETRAFIDELRSTIDEGKNNRHWADSTINRILAHLKTLAKWIHKLDPFLLGNPMDKLKQLHTPSRLNIERAITPQERRLILDAADTMLKTRGISRDKKRFKRPENRPRSLRTRPYRDRAIIYCLIETGMRRYGLVNINFAGFNHKGKKITTVEKGGSEHTYSISSIGVQAIQDYIGQERHLDDLHWQSPALFQLARTIPLKNVENRSDKGRLSLIAINRIWNQVCYVAKVKGKSPHSSRHAMGRHLMDKFKNPEAVQLQLGHKNVGYSIQYSRVTSKEIDTKLDERI
jgi:integrase